MSRTYSRVNFSSSDRAHFYALAETDAVLPPFGEFVRQAYFEKLARLRRVHSPGARPAIPAVVSGSSTASSTSPGSPQGVL